MEQSEIKEKWLTALRSGKYHQTTGYLRKAGPEEGCDGFCCLGVLCDVINPNGWHQAPDGNWYYGEGAEIAFFPIYLRDQSGLTNSLEIKLMGMNDSEKCTFAEIADYIEENL